MTPELREIIREHARLVAAEAPPLTEEQHTHLSALLRPVVALNRRNTGAARVGSGHPERRAA